MPLARNAAVWLASVVMATACGDGGGSSGPPAPSCEEGELAVEGILDGQDVSERFEVLSYSWRNLPSDDRNATLTVSTEEGAALHVEWGRTIAHDESAEAAGFLDLSDAGGFDVGNCEDDGFVSQVTSRPGGAEFLLEDLYRAPYCGGDEADGYLVGCTRSPPFDF